MKRTRILPFFSLALCAGFLLSTVASAATLTVFNDRTSWENAVGGLITTETFDAAPIGEIVDGASLDTGLLTLTQAANGTTGDLNIADGSDFGNINGTPFVDGFTGGDPGATVTVDFNGASVIGFGADWVSPGSGAGIKLAVLDAEASLLPLGSSAGFFGVVSDTPFTSLEILRDGSSGVFAEVWSGDDFSYGVPEPASMTLWAFGILYLARLRRQN